MELPVPPAFRLETDTSPADWLVAALRPWGKDHVRLWSFLPDDYEAYARLPARGDRPESPRTARLAILAELLAPFTTTPGRCFVASWVGWGSWSPGSSATLTAFRSRRARPRRWVRTPTGERLPLPAPPGWWSRRKLMAQVQQARRWLDSIPQVRTQHRQYYLFTARLADVASFAINGFPEEPNIWWPADRAWCVSKEVDGDDIHVGGSRESVAAILASDGLAAVPAHPDEPLGAAG